MRFLHMADVHLAAVPENGTKLGKIRAAEIYQTFYRAVAHCEETGIDLLLIAGDLFHREPLVQELREVNYRLGRLTRTKVALIAGNHDYIGPHSNYNNFVWADNVVMLRSDKMESVYFEQLHTRVYGFSYHGQDYHEPLPTELAPLFGDEVSILMVHGGEPGKAPFDRKILGAAGFDYVALGHIHSIHDRILPRGAYAGTPEPLDRNEIGPHGYYEGEIAAHGGALSLKFVPAAVRNYLWLDLEVTPGTTGGELTALCRSEILRRGKEHMYRVRLRGRRAPELVIDKEALFSAGIVVEVQDETRQDF